MIPEFLQIIISLIVLTALELILSIDNILFVGIISENLQGKLKSLARQFGVAVAIVGRVVLLLSINWLYKLNNPLFHLYSFGVSIKDLIMLIGGLYLIYFSLTKILEEIKHKSKVKQLNTPASFFKALLIIFFFDSLFSFDSVLTAVAIGHNIVVMVVAILLSTLVLFFSVNTISNFIEKHPSLKMLALSFLLLVGVSLLGSGLHYELNGSLMFIIIAFAAFVQFVTIKNIINKQK